MSKIKVKCPECAGSGRIELTEALLDVLGPIQKAGTMRMFDIYPKVGLSRGAINPRLKQLVAFGLIRIVENPTDRRNKTLEYVAKSKTKKAKV